MRKEQAREDIIMKREDDVIMSNKERVLQLIDDIPDEKLIPVVTMMEYLIVAKENAIQPNEGDNER